MDLKDSDIVCLCKHVDAKKIRDAIKDGADTVEDVGKKTCAGTECGACKKIIEEMILPRDYL